MNVSQMLQAFGHGSQHSGMDAHYVPRGRKQLALCNEPWSENPAAEARAPQSNLPTHAVGTPGSTPARSHTAISTETPSPNQQSPAGGEPPLSPIGASAGNVEGMDCWDCGGARSARGW